MISPISEKESSLPPICEKGRCPPFPSVDSFQLSAAAMGGRVGPCQPHLAAFSCPFSAQTCTHPFWKVEGWHSMLPAFKKAGTPCFPPSNRRAQFRWLPGPSTSCSRDLAIQLHPPQPSLTLSKFSLQAILPSVCSGPGDSVVGKAAPEDGAMWQEGLCLPRAALTGPGALTSSPAGTLRPLQTYSSWVIKAVTRICAPCSQNWDTSSESRLDSKPGCVKSAWEGLDTVGSLHVCAYTSDMVAGPRGLLHLRPSWSSSSSPCARERPLPTQCKALPAARSHQVVSSLIPLGRSTIEHIWTQCTHLHLCINSSSPQTVLGAGYYSCI